MSKSVIFFRLKDKAARTLKEYQINPRLITISRVAVEFALSGGIKTKTLWQYQLAS